MSRSLPADSRISLSRRVALDCRPECCVPKHAFNTVVSPSATQNTHAVTSQSSDALSIFELMDNFDFFYCIPACCVYGMTLCTHLTALVTVDSKKWFHSS